MMMSSERRTVVAPGRLQIAGGPYSRATTAAWERKPPRSDYCIFLPVMRSSRKIEANTMVATAKISPRPTQAGL